MTTGEVPVGTVERAHRTALGAAGGVFTDRTAVAMALAAVGGAWIAHPGVAVGVAGVILGVGAFIVRRPWLLIVGVALVSSGSAARATAGLAIEPGVWTGTVEVLHVATTSRGDLHAEVRAGGHHLDLLPLRGDRRTVATADPGDRLVVSGRITPVDPHVSRSRGSHVAGRLHAVRISPGGRPRIPWRVAGSVRHRIVALAAPLSVPQRALFEGFVLGDASRQTAVQRADFRASGLTHLLVASGENIAFVLMLASPLTSRVGLRGRWVTTLGLCVLYALVTGLEPSVLRAATMAVVATSAAGVGRPVRSWRSLAYAVTVLVLADPFLVHATAFGLSVGASAGILGLARPVAAALPGPRWLTGPLAVTIAAQIGVAPLLLGFPAGMPVAAVPANLLAAVPAGLVMVLGIPALVLVASGLPGSAVFVWIPRVLLGWVDTVARRTAALPTGYLGAGALAVSVAGLGVALAVGRDRFTWLRRTGWMVAGLGLCAPMIVGAGSGAGEAPGASPVVVRRGGAVIVVVTGRVPDETLLSTLSVARVRDIDLVVVPHGDRADVAMLDTIAHRHRIGGVLAPSTLPGTRWTATVVAPGSTVTVVDAAVEVLAVEPLLTVHVLGNGPGP